MAFCLQGACSAARATAAVTVVWISVFCFGEIKFSNALGACCIILNEVTANLNYSSFVALAGTAPLTFTLIVNIWLLVIACKRIIQIIKRVRQNTITALHG